VVVLLEILEEMVHQDPLVVILKAEMVVQILEAEVVAEVIMQEVLQTVAQVLL
jgi:hypothetical protein